MASTLPTKVKIGNCGWSYYSPPPGWEERFGSKLQAYAGVFGLVEINSTFYGIPKMPTARKWREEADAVNPKFEFTVKVSRIITHTDKFSSGKSLRIFGVMKDIGRELRAKVLLFQSPESFGPSEGNLENARKFFGKVDPEEFILSWEVRWEDRWGKDVVGRLFSGCGVNQCVDPLRQDCHCAKDVLYCRLHGFGSPMYNYSFSDDELKKVIDKIKSGSAGRGGKRKPAYVLFNNGSCYEDARRLEGMLRVSP